MRKSLTLLFLVGSTTLFGQFTRHFSLLVGAGWSGKYSSSEGGTFKEIEGYRTSRMTGVGFNFDFIKRSSFEANLMLQQTGSNYIHRFGDEEIFRNRLTALSLQLSLAYRYTWIKNQKFGLHSKFGFLVVKPIHLVNENIQKVTSRVGFELSIKDDLRDSYFFPYYMGISVSYQDIELGLGYTHSPSSDVRSSTIIFVNGNSIFSNLQFELRYRIY